MSKAFAVNDNSKEAGCYDDIGDSIFAEQLQRLFVGFVANLMSLHQLLAKQERGNVARMMPLGRVQPF